MSQQNPEEGESEKSTQGTNGPGVAINGQEKETGKEFRNKSARTERLKEVGRKSINPIYQVLQGYQDELIPYFAAVSRGFKESSLILQRPENNEAERVVGNWFAQVSSWSDSLKNRWQHTSKDELIHFLETEGRRHPGLMFGLSYLAGIGLGRFGKILGHKSTNTSSNLQ